MGTTRCPRSSVHCSCGLQPGGLRPGVRPRGPNPSTQLDLARASTPDAPLKLVTESTGARAYWKAGFTGKGVDIAIIDSGVAPVNGLSAPGKVILGPDFSFESQDPATRYLDTNGHGTHLAGIMAGRADDAKNNYFSDTKSFLGMAPDARIVSVKVADSFGRTDVSQVIAAIDWVVQHKNDNGMNIRVLLLAYGTDSTAPWNHDPLVQAAETAWKNGIFVVVSAGNDGPGKKESGMLANLAESPNLMAVGATDTMGTTDVGDDTVANFSSAGTGDRKVNIVAPGSHIVSLAVPNSHASETFASTGDAGVGLFRGSGTSQAAAVVAGGAALVIQKNPGMNPDQLKNWLESSAKGLKKEKSTLQGKGALDLNKTLGKVPSVDTTTVSTRTWSDGLGTLESVRGSVRLEHNGQVLEGNKDIFGAPYNSNRMAMLRESGSVWSGGEWNGNEWTASSWSASSWSASSWSASSWSASSWSASSWSASSWSASSWSASSWSASSWSASSWSASSWSASSWSAADWK